MANIAHTLDVDHDDSNVYSTCEHDSNAYVMSRHYSIERTAFSFVSRSVIYNYLRNVLKFNPECLGKVNEYKFSYEELRALKAPTLDEQCEGNFSKNFKSNQPPMGSPEFCDRLYCKHGFLEFKNFPVMNGTPCGVKPKMICCFGNCVLNCTFEP